MNRWDNLIRNNTGYSAKNFMLFIDLTHPGYQIQSDMTAMAGIITALGGLIGYLFNRKVKSEQYENRNPNQSNHDV